jgi:hypothetical protein
MLENYPANWHYAYRWITRHWHAASERFAGGDSLMTALNGGWQIVPPVVAETHWRAGTRCVMVYTFELKRGAETMTMPVITNPFVERLIADNALPLMPQRHLVHSG